MRGHAIGIKLERIHAAMMLNFHARERTRKITQDRIKPFLRTDREIHGRERTGLCLALGWARHAAQFIAAHVCDKHDVHRIIGRERTIMHILRNAPTAAEFHGADIDFVHFRRGDRAIALFDQAAGNAAPAKIGGEREAHGAAANDENRDLRSVLDFFWHCIRHFW